MILVLLNWTFILIFLLPAGFVSLTLLLRASSVRASYLSFSCVMLVGLVVLTTLCNVFSLFMAIDYKVNLILGAVIYGFLFFLRTEFIKNTMKWLEILKTLHLSTKLAFLLIFIIGLIKTISPSENADEAGYHIPLIRWIEDYSIVPGIANIEDRMGFNPGIYMSNAFFSMRWLFTEGLYDLNSFLFFIFGTFFLSGFERFVKKDFSYIYSDITQIVALIFLFRAYLTSVDADFIYIYGIMYILILVLQKIESSTLSQPSVHIAMIFLLFTFIFTNKFSVILLSPIILWILWETNAKQNFRFVFTIVAVCTFILSSWILRNYFISGYLIYPLYFIDVFNVDWKVPIELTKGQYFYVSEYAKIEETRPFNQYIIREVPFKEWTAGWFSRVGALLIGKIIIPGIPISFILFFYLIIVKNKKWDKVHNQYMALIFFLIIATLIWIVRIPAIRFAWGWLIVLFVLTASMSFRKILVAKITTIRIMLMVVLFTSLLRSSIASFINYPLFLSNWFYPSPIMKGSISKVVKWGDEKIYIATDNFCGNITPPCLPEKHHPNLVLRGNKVKNGFKITSNGEK